MRIVILCITPSIVLASGGKAYFSRRLFTGRTVMTLLRFWEV